MTIRDAFPDLIATDDDDSVISRYTDAHDNELEEIEGELDEILVTFQLRQIDLYGQRPDSSYSINYIDTDGNEQTLEVASFSLVEDIPDVDEVISVFDDGREYILDGDYELFFIDSELEGIEWTPERNNPSFDRIGQLFGEIGRRRGRNDREYRRFLNSLVPVLSGRGQVPTLKEAVAISLSMDAESIGVEENFEELEFEIILSDFWESHQGSAIESIVDRAKPSGVEHVSTRYQVPDEELLGATAVATTDGQQAVAESESSFDLVLLSIRITETFEDTTIADVVTALDNDREAFENTTIADVVTALDNDREALEQSLSDVSVAEDLDVEVWTTTQWDLNRWDADDWDQNVPYVPTEANDSSEQYVENFVFEEPVSTDSTIQSIQQDIEEPTDIVDITTEHVTIKFPRTTDWDNFDWDSANWSRGPEEAFGFAEVDDRVAQQVPEESVSEVAESSDVTVSIEDSTDTLDLTAVVTGDVTLLLDVNRSISGTTVSESVDQKLTPTTTGIDTVQAENFNNAWDLGNYDGSLWA